MLKFTDKRRARYLLEVREQGGPKLLHFIRVNEMRYIFLIGYFALFSGCLAFTGQWFLFWIFVGFSLGVLVADLSWLRGTQKSWPFVSRTMNWDEVKRVSDEEPSA
jgi:hypothetical protein